MCKISRGSGLGGAGWRRRATAAWLTIGSTSMAGTLAGAITERAQHEQS